MELLKEIAKDKLVIMVTHNPELADQYATRIIRIKDGHLTGDSDPFDPKKAKKEESKKEKLLEVNDLIVVKSRLAFHWF